MAQIVLGMGSSHTPQLGISPEKWRAYGDRTRGSGKVWFAGSTYTHDELVDLRADSHFERECTEEKFRTRYNACQQGIAHLSQTLNRVAPDAVIIIGDPGQSETFQDDNMPSIAIYHGATADDVPPDTGVRQYFDDPIVGNIPPERVTHPTDAVLGEYLIEALTENEFDVSRSNQLRQANRGGAIGHAFYYVYRRLMNNEVIPNVPVIVSSHLPPNAPKTTRCYKLGQALRKAVEAWDSNKRVAIIASGGLSHVVIEEDLDNQILDGLKHDDLDKLTGSPDVRFRAGTGEIKHWIVVAGAMSGTGLQMNLVDYVPCYRTEAGTGVGMGFAEWV